MFIYLLNCLFLNELPKWYSGSQGFSVTESKEFDGEKMSALHPVADSIFLLERRVL